MFKSLCLFALINATLSLRIQKEEESAAEKCGVVLGAFGSQAYIQAGAHVAERIRHLNVTKGWCPQDLALDYIPVTLFTDAKHLTLSRTKESQGCPQGVNCLPETAMEAAPESLQLRKAVRPRLGGWTTRWYHAQIMVSSPYNLGIYLDLDAVPCSGDKLGYLLKQMTDSNAAIGTLIHANWPCLQTGNDCSKPHPEGADVHEWSKFKERNAGVIVFEKERALSLLKDYGKYIVESANMGKIKGDQYAFRATLFVHKSEVPEIIYKNNEICRYGSTSCKAGCAIVHKHEDLSTLTTIE